MGLTAEAVPESPSGDAIGSVAFPQAASGGHGGDLPNIYAASDGSARADFFTVGITLDEGRDRAQVRH